MQRSKEWFDQRIGKFTSSRIHELMGIKGLGKTGESYAFEMAVEIACGKNHDDDFFSFDMLRGIELEPLAFSKFQELKQQEFIDVETCGFFKFTENTGGSPDGIVSDDAILEIKCPKPNKFLRLVCDNQIDSQYIDQMQHQMMVACKSKAYFFNYCIYNGEPLWHTIVVDRDDSRIELMQQRISEASKLRDNYIYQILNNKQWK